MSIKQMLGMVFTQVYNDKDEILVFRNDDFTFQFLHHQDCCEDVHIESIVGDLQDLVGSPILLADISSNDNEHDYEEWTFYKFATRKGYVDVRWIGSSNGYYSTSVSLNVINHKLN